MIIDELLVEDLFCSMTKQMCHAETIGDCEHCYTYQNLQGMAEELVTQTEEEANEILKQWREEIEEATKDVQQAMQSGRVCQDEQILRAFKGTKQINKLK